MSPELLGSTEAKLQVQLNQLYSWRGLVILASADYQSVKSLSW